MTKHHWNITLALLLSCPLAAGSAGADEPGLALPALEADSGATAQGQIAFIETPALADTTIMTLVPAASLALGSKLSLQATIPLLWGRAQTDSTGTLGNLTVSGRYLRPLTAETSGPRLELGVSVSLPSAGDSGLGAAVCDARALLEVTDPGLYLSRTTTVRAHAGYGIASSRLFSRVRATGQFLRISAANAGEMQILGDDNQLRLVGELASGLRVAGGLWLVGELAGSSAVVRGGGDRFLANLRAGGRYRVSDTLGVAVHAALPLNGEPRSRGGLAFTSAVDTTF